MKIRREYNNGISQMYTDFTRQRSTLSNRFNNLIYQHNFKRRHTNSQTSQLVKSSISCESNNKIMNEKLDEPNKNISYTPLTVDSLNEQTIFYTIPVRVTNRSLKNSPYFFPNYENWI